MLYVLTLQMKGPLGAEWRPVGVVDNETTANQWADSGADKDWIGFELNDLSVTGLSDKKFEPKPPAPAEELAESTSRKLQQTNAKLISIIQQLAERYKDKNVLSVLDDLKREGKVSSKTAAEFDDLEVGQRVWWGYGSNPPAGTLKKLVKNRKSPHLSIATVEWDDEKYGTFDIHINKLSTGQKAMFDEGRAYASAKSADQSWMTKRFWHENKAYHTTDCNFRKDMFGACTCMNDKLPGGKKGCKDCGQTRHHAESCPRIKQQALFASDLLRKQNG